MHRSFSDSLDRFWDVHGCFQGFGKIVSGIPRFTKVVCEVGALIGLGDPLAATRLLMGKDEESRGLSVRRL